MTRVRMAGWCDVDAHMRFDGNEGSQAEILHVKGDKHMRYSGTFHGKLFAA